MPWKFISVSSIFVGHFRSGIITVLILRASKHNLMSPFFFSVQTMGDNHGEVDLSIIPNFSMRCISESTLGIRATGIGYCRWCIGSPGLTRIWH